MPLGWQVNNMANEKAKKKKYHLKLPSDSANLDIIREFVGKIAQNMGFNEDDINKIELAVDEASTNVIKHAYKGSEKDNKIIDIDIVTFSNRLEIMVTDRGKGFIPNRIKEPNMKEYLKQMKRGGLGIYLIKSLMDKVVFNIHPGTKNQVKMVKYLT